MPTEMLLKATHQGGMRVLAEADGHRLPTDYPLEPGQATEGMTSLQLLLASLTTCSANGVRILLERRMGATLQGLEVEARAQRRDEHPTVLTAIDLVFRLKGQGLDTTMVAKALEVAETQLCPVWAMLRGSTPIRTEFHIEQA